MFYFCIGMIFAVLAAGAVDGDGCGDGCGCGCGGGGGGCH